MNIFRWLKNKIVKHRHMIIPMLIVLILPNLVGILIGYEYSNYPFKNADTIIVNHDESDTAVAPASISSNASSVLCTPPIPIIGIFTAWAA